MNETSKEYEYILNANMCGKELNEYNQCIQKASSKKSVKVCRDLFKTYQFCLASVESDRRDQSKLWDAYKEKWGSYPNEVNNP